MPTMHLGLPDPGHQSDGNAIETSGGTRSITTGTRSGRFRPFPARPFAAPPFAARPFMTSRRAAWAPVGWALVGSTLAGLVLSELARRVYRITAKPAGGHTS